MESIKVGRKKYRWLYEERDGTHWYVPASGYSIGDKTAINLTAAELLKHVDISR